MSIFENQSYIQFITKTQYAKILLDNILKYETKLKKFESLIKKRFLYSLSDYQNIGKTQTYVTEKELNLFYHFSNISELNEKIIETITDNRYYYNMLERKYKEYFDLNNLNQINDFNLFFICEISIINEIPKNSLKLQVNSPNYFGLFNSDNQYKGYLIAHILEISDILYNSFKVS